MKDQLLFLGIMFLLVGAASAQMYDGKHDELVNPMDRAVVEVNDMYSNVPVAGAREDVTPQDVRYQNMTEPLDEANDRHFESATNFETIIEKSEK